MMLCKSYVCDFWTSIFLHVNSLLQSKYNKIKRILGSKLGAPVLLQNNEGKNII